MENFKGQVSQIISPYKENRPFDVYLKINGININLDKSNDELRDLAISRFNSILMVPVLQFKEKQNYQNS